MGKHKHILPVCGTLCKSLLDQVGTEGLKKLLKENLTIKTLSLAEQPEIFWTFFNSHLNKSRLTKTVQLFNFFDLNRLRTPLPFSSIFSEQFDIVLVECQTSLCTKLQPCVEYKPFQLKQV